VDKREWTRTNGAGVEAEGRIDDHHLDCNRMFDGRLKSCWRGGKRSSRIWFLGEQADTVFGDCSYRAVQTVKAGTTALDHVVHLRCTQHLQRGLHNPYCGEEEHCRTMRFASSGRAEQQEWGCRMGCMEVRPAEGKIERSGTAFVVEDEARRGLACRVTGRYHLAACCARACGEVSTEL
jgi:hypothetical protein